MECWHMSGAGNDFMVIDARGKTLDFSHLAKTLCAQTGADGFMAVDHSATADFRLHFYNSDGSRGEMCGNGSRCVCKFAYDHGIAGKDMTVQTDAGIIRGWHLDDQLYRVQLNLPSVADLHRKGDIAYVELGNPGVPHAVAEVPGLSHDDREKLRDHAKALRFDPAFPKGANVNFYTWLDDKSIRILTYERGVEDYTLACGTGSASTAAVLYLQGKLPGGFVTVENPGGNLAVTIGGDGRSIHKVLLEGSAIKLQSIHISEGDEL